MNFIPYSEEAEHRLDEQLKGTLFGNIENFVNFYNSGMIAKRSDEILELTREVIDTYKNLEEKGGQIIFLSTSEVYLEESINALEAWVPVVKIIRELNNAKEEGKIQEDTVIAFAKEKKLGYALAVIQKEDGNVLKRIGNEKTFTRAQQIADIFNHVSSTQQQDDGYYFFRASDFLHLDDSFITTIHREIPNV